ncbi:MAG TPA: formylglycine-generating enzyme family protein [Candidatus Hydrogenedentes bacterium]|nr:formylglycine-generating enzyme family protein [Candidatus Hydrogenedentota bacterium]HPG66307.1 formylglycine-generating enzyme family protein [Candidatus Hydrogenedentota bacterium]
MLRRAPLVLMLALALLLPACGMRKAERPDSPPKAAPSSPEASGPPQPGETRTFAGIEFVWVPPGEFLMGATKTPEDLFRLYQGDLRWYANEVPRHPVAITKGFWLGKYEITQAQWQKVMGSNPSGTDPECPVDKISWDDCQTFVAELHTRTNEPFRLPTEAEWEYACRAGGTTEFHFGDGKADLRKYAWFSANSGGQSHPVGKKEPNAWNLHDMHGNVWEFCQDWCDRAYYAKSPKEDPQGPESGEYRMLRGGSFKRSETKCRCSFRSWNKPEYATAGQGLRICRDADAE